MIISHKHKFIFLKTHKTGGTSLQIALSRHCGADDIISRIHHSDQEELQKAGGLDQQNSKVSLTRFNNRDWFQYLLRGRQQHFSEHLEARNIKRWLGDDIWNSYYKFCFERNPFDKVLSYYYWRTRNKEVSIDQFLEENLKALSDFSIYTINNNICVDDVFLYENLKSSIDLLENRFQFEIDITNVKAKSSHRPKSQSSKEILTSNQMEKISKAFEREINLYYPDLTY